MRPHQSWASRTPGGTAKDRGTHVLDVLVERVVGGEVALERDEARAHVPLVGEEEQARVEPAQAVGAVGEGVAPAQDGRPVVGVGMREPHVRVGLHRLQERLVVLLGLADRGALALVAAEHVLLFLQRGAVPGLDVHPDAPGDQVRPAGHPRRPVAVADPHELLQPVRLGARDVAGAVLEAEEVARGLRVRGGGGGLAEAELGPAHGHRAEADAGQVADGVHGDLQVVGAGLDAQVAAGAGPVQVVAGELGRVDEGLGPPVGQAEPVEQRRPEPDGQGQPGRLSPSASPVSSGGASASPP